MTQQVKFSTALWVYILSLFRDILVELIMHNWRGVAVHEFDGWRFLAVTRFCGAWVLCVSFRVCLFLLSGPLAVFVFYSMLFLWFSSVVFLCLSLYILICAFYLYKLPFKKRKKSSTVGPPEISDRAGLRNVDKHRKSNLRSSKSANLLRRLYVATICWQKSWRDEHWRHEHLDLDTMKIL